MEEHLQYNDLDASYQSACGRDHSTESALLKVLYVIGAALDEVLAAAFSNSYSYSTVDAINHAIPLKRFEFSSWHEGTSFNLSKVVPHLQNSMYSISNCASRFWCIAEICFTINELLYVY